MKKLTLDLYALAVESFHTAVTHATSAGTIRAHESAEPGDQQGPVLSYTCFGTGQTIDGDCVTAICTAANCTAYFYCTGGACAWEGPYTQAIDHCKVSDACLTDVTCTH